MIPFLLKVMRKWIASRIPSCRNCSVLLNWCLDFEAELQAGAKCPNLTHGFWEECTETIQRGALFSISSCIISKCTKWQNHAFHWNWSGGVVERVLKRKDHGRGYAAWNLRLRPILHLASNYRWKAMLIMCHYMTPQRRFANGKRS